MRRRFASVLFLLLLMSGPLAPALPRPTQMAFSAAPRWCVPSGDAEIQRLTLQVMQTMLPNAIVVANDIVVFASQYRSPAVVAVDLATGVERWRHPVDYGRVLLAAASIDESVFFASTMAGAVSAGALNVDDGSLRWSFDAKGGMATPPAIGDGAVVLDLADGGIVALDALSGEQRWWATSDLRAGPILATERMAISGLMNGQVSARDAETGVERWRVDVDGSSGWAWTGSAAGGSFYLVAWSGAPALSSAELFAIEIDSGSVRWRIATAGLFATPPAATDSNVYIAFADGTLRALDNESGVETWSWQLRSDELLEAFVGPPPTITDDLLLIAGTTYEDARLGSAIHAIDPDTGQEQWRVRASDLVDTSPQTSGGLVIVNQFDVEDEAQVCAYDIPHATLPPFA